MHNMICSILKNKLSFKFIKDMWRRLLHKALYSKTVVSADVNKWLKWPTSSNKVFYYNIIVKYVFIVYMDNKMYKNTISL